MLPECLPRRLDRFRYRPDATGEDKLPRYLVRTAKPLRARRRMSRKGIVRDPLATAEVISVRRYPSKGYEVRTLRLNAEDGGPPRKGQPSMKMQAAFALESGCYIGDPKDAAHLAKRGISPELADTKHKTCSVGKSRIDGKWYGWSHRAIRGFKSREAAVRFAKSVS